MDNVTKSTGLPELDEVAGLPAMAQTYLAKLNDREKEKVDYVPEKP